MSDQVNEATPTPTQIVQQAAEDYLSTSNAPGCCIAVYDENSFGTAGYVYPKGLSSAPSPAPAPFAVTADTVFEIGSVTKVFTSTLLAFAVKAGVGTLDDDVGYWLNFQHKFSPDHIGSAVLDPLQLIRFATHTSGMPEQPDNLTDYSKQLFADEPPSADLIKWWDRYDIAPTLWPGCWQYSNIGFVTLGFAVTQMFSNEPGYNAILAKYITGPLGMTQTGAVVDPTSQAAKGCIGSWSKNSQPPPPIVFDGNTPTGGSAFDLKSTGNDMLKFVAAQVAPQGDLAPAILLTQQPQGTFPECGTTNSVTMGLAWQITKTKQGQTVLMKNGATSKGGFEAIVIVVPELRCGVAVLSNQYFDSSGVHPADVGPGSAAHQIIAQLHPGFEPTEPLAEHQAPD